MTPQQQKVYAQFQPLIARLTSTVATLAAFPLDDMKAVAERLTLTGTLVGHHQGVSVDPVKAARLRELIEATIAYKDEALKIAASVEGGAS